MWCFVYLYFFPSFRLLWLFVMYLFIWLIYIDQAMIRVCFAHQLTSTIPIDCIYKTIPLKGEHDAPDNTGETSPRTGLLPRGRSRPELQPRRYRGRVWVCVLEAEQEEEQEQQQEQQGPSDLVSDLRTFQPTCLKHDNKLVQWDGRKARRQKLLRRATLGLEKATRWK